MTQNLEIPDVHPGDKGPDVSSKFKMSDAGPEITVALLTGGSDKPYLHGLTTALGANGATMDLIGSDELDVPELRTKPGVNFLNLRGDQRSDATFTSKILRVLAYYTNLICYAATSRARIFHILWNNKFEAFDRTLLMLYYRLLGKKIALTAHNVNMGRRDFTDTVRNRLTLWIQYRLADHIFVHTEKMKVELIKEFHVPEAHISVIPFGINNAVPNTSLSTSEVRQRMGIRDNEKAILFFGRITPYKGLEYLIAAFRGLLAGRNEYRLIIAGRLEKGCEQYWDSIREAIREDVQRGRILLKAEFIPDEETELYFKAADVLVLPYRHIYQSGVLFLGYSFGLPVLAADVGSLKDEIIEGKTGLVFRPEDPADLARTIERYFASELYKNLSTRRQEIQSFSAKRNSWDVVGQITMKVYGGLLQLPLEDKSLARETSKASMDVNAP